MSEHHHRSDEQASDEKNVSMQPQQTEELAPVVIEEIGGPEGLEPTRYGDWERKGRCIDF